MTTRWTHRSGGWRRVMLAAALTVLGADFTAGAVGTRLNDDEVKQLLERVHHDRDRFEDQLDGQLKRSTLRGPGGEVQVERYLDDLQDNVNRLRDRFSDSYAAEQEVTTV